jgi:hypothetical protein
MSRRLGLWLRDVRRADGSRRGRRSQPCRRCDRLSDDKPAAAPVCRRGGFRRHRHGRRRRRGNRRRIGSRGRIRRQEPEWVEVAELVGCQTDPEVDVRNGLLGRSARPHRGDGVTLGDGRALRDDERAEMRERHRVAVGGLDREALATRRHEAGEAHRPARRRDDRIALRRGADVDAAVLARGVRVRLVVRERLEHRPMDRPAPRLRDRRANQKDHECRCQFEQHRERE